MNLRQRLAASTARTGLLVTAGLLLSSTASAQLDPISLTLSQTAFETGETAYLTLDAEPFHIPIMIFGRSQGPTVVPGLGTFGVGLTPKPKIMILPPLPPSGERTFDCGFDCDSPLREKPFYIQVLTFDPFGADYAGLSNTVTLQQVDGDCGACVDESETDPDFAKYGGGHALYLPGIDKKLAFQPGGKFVERSDGTARLTGVVSSTVDPSHSFFVDVLLSDRCDPLFDQAPPAGSPKLELKAEAYLDAGGPIDPRDWRYYKTTSGILTGLDCYEGAIVEVSRRGPAFQVGPGANGKNLNFGGSGWLDYETLAQPVACATFPSTGTGDFNLDTHADCIDCTEEAGDHAITMPALGRDFLFVEGGEFEQLQDGTARLAGTIENDDDPMNRWEVEVLFSNRINPGNAAYPPSGSPKKELGSSSYVENGGPVDTDTWHYYTTFGGVLKGIDGNAGDSIVLRQRGPAMQVGLGASGKNELYGASCWLWVDYYPAGAQTPVSSKGDINIDIVGDCPTDD